jgi:predicted unusual protein kinase regulating ubiquinone biosynthesis (AarF/ABC1/UbiB family)
MPHQDSPIPRGRVRRTMPLAAFTVRAAGGRRVAGLREKAGDHGAVRRFHERTAQHYADLLGHSRGALMKAGQMLSMIDTGVVDSGGLSPYRKALARLHANAPPMGAALLRDVLDAELGSATEQFAQFNEQPLAATSIGQVHHAILGDGREVAVKIQYPGVARAIRDDLANTELVATLLRWVTAVPKIEIDTRELARQAGARICEEVDYRHEAAMISAFSGFYRDHPFIRIPEVVYEVSGDRVLTMTYLDGLDWEAAQHADQDLKNTWAEVIWRFSYGNFRHANLLDADPHHRNYRFNTDGSVGFLDFGCVKVIPESHRRHWVGITRAIVEYRPEDARDLMAMAGFFDDVPITAAELQHHWADFIPEMVATPQPAQYTPDNTRRRVRGMFGARGDNPLTGIAIPEHFAMIGRAQCAISSVCTALQPSLAGRAIADDIDNAAEPITELGKLHHAWVRETGLAAAPDHHDHP